MPSRVKPALFGGIITGLTIGLPGLGLLNCFCCAGVLFGGLLSVFFYTRDLLPEMPGMTSSDALQLGALSGAFGALIGVILETLVLASLGDVFHKIFSSIMGGQNFTDILPPEAADALQQMLTNEQRVSTVHFFALLFIWLIIGPLFGMIGGLLGHAIWRPRFQIVPQAIATNTNQPDSPPRSEQS